MFYSSNQIPLAQILSNNDLKFKDVFWSDSVKKLLFSDGVDSYISFRVHGSIRFKLYKHSWSGIVQIKADGIIVDSIDLFSFGEEEFYSSFYDAKEEIQILLTGCNPQSKGFELWLFGVDSKESQRWYSDSIVLNNNVAYTKGVYGDFLTLNRDKTIGSTIAAVGVWANSDIELFKKVIASNDFVVDVGANIGHHTIVFSKLVGRAGKVISFEPQKMIYNLLAANVALNACDNVTLFNTCVGSKCEYLNLYPISYEGEENFGALGVNLDKQDIAGERCYSNKLDYFISSLDFDVRHVSFIKIDVQSFEFYVLQGALLTITNFNPIVFLEISPGWMLDAGYNYKRIYEFFHSLNYVIYHPHDPDLRGTDIKAWNGSKSHEWDILAFPRTTNNSFLKSLNL